MRKFLRNKLALSTPIGSIILLVVSVMLCTVVTYFAFNVASTRLQEESLYLSKCHLWYKNSTFSIGALVIVNTGATDIVLNKITIKGEECVWNGTSTFILYNKTINLLAADLPYNEDFSQTGNNTVAIGATAYKFVVASENLILPSRCLMIVYIVNPGNIMVYDVGRPIRVVVSTAQALYATETMPKASD